MHTQPIADARTETLTIRRVEPRLMASLRGRAERHGRSMKAELRAILRDALACEEEEEVDLATAIRRRMERIDGGVDIPEAPAMPFPSRPISESGSLDLKLTEELTRRMAHERYYCRRE